VLNRCGKGTAVCWRDDAHANSELVIFNNSMMRPEEGAMKNESSGREARSVLGSGENITIR